MDARLVNLSDGYDGAFQFAFHGAAIVDVFREIGDAKIGLVENLVADPAGLRKARAGQLKGFTGIDDPYEEPTAPELTIDATNTSPQQAAELLLKELDKRGLLAPTANVG